MMAGKKINLSLSSKNFGAAFMAAPNILYKTIQL